MEPEDTDPKGLAPFSRFVFLVAIGTVALLASLSDRYGYHRDELYFLAAGQHLAWGYPDQPPLVPALARVAHSIAPSSLVVLRVPSALAAGGSVVVTGLVAREFGGRSAAQLLASVSIASSALLLSAGHYLDTTIFDLLVWTLLIWLVLRILRTGCQQLWLVVGIVAGCGLLNNDLVAFLAVGLAIGFVICGPRPIFGSPWLWIGSLIALLIWTPYLLWQGHHGWPEVIVSRSIASGGSGTSTPRALLVPEQLVLVSPYLSPIWIAGLVRLFRDPRLRWCRSFGWTYVVLAVVFVATGGKAYYLAGFVPALIGAGAQPAIDWMRRGRSGARRTLAGCALVLTVVSTILFTLPVLPLAILHRTPIVALNYDEGETIGWSTYVDEIADVYRQVPAPERVGTSVLASNYGEAGAVDRFGPALGLPHAFSGQDGFWYWGPPPSTSNSFVVVGFDQRQLTRWFARCVLGGHLSNTHQVKNQEQGTPIWTCRQLRHDWSELWPQFRNLG
jgi:4-amino-4-deoxy-L-arabinose transferase-like glycosyltransferase